MANAIIPLDMPNLRIPIVTDAFLAVPHMGRLLTDIIRRLGGQRIDYVQEARVRAYQNEAMMLAVLRGVTTGYYHTPSNPLSFTATSDTLATISVAQHTRSTAAAPIQAGSVANVSRGTTHYVYYSDAGNAGGAVTFLATTDVSGLTTAGVKLIGAIYVEEKAPPGGGTSA